jgi:hypothetical protein
VAELPDPGTLGLPGDAVVAVPRAGLTVYRLVSGTPSESDFHPTSKRRAQLLSIPEILRVGLSHYLSYDAARSVARRPDSVVASVHLEPRRDVHVARTGRNPDHVTVWARPDDLLSWTRVHPR